jgi:hypothetical protein
MYTKSNNLMKEGNDYERKQDQSSSTDTGNVYDRLGLFKHLGQHI